MDIVYGLIVGMVIGIIVMGSYTSQYYTSNKVLIKKGFAYYNTTTGAFQLK